MVKRQHRKGRRRSAPSQTTTPICVRMPNDLLKDVRSVLRAVARETQFVYYPDESASLKDVVREALSALVQRRIEQNRRFLDRLDSQGRDRERDFGLCIDRLTEPDPRYPRRPRKGWTDPCEEMLQLRYWRRRRVHRLDDVPQATGKVPTDPPVLFEVPRLPPKAER